jgi:PXPV repeat (3 copies)
MKTTTFSNRSMIVSGASALLALAAMAFSSAADARDNVSFSVGIGVPGVQVGVSNAYPVYGGYPQPVYGGYAQPVYVQPAPVYVQPQPVYRARPIYFQPAPVYVPAPVYYGRQHGWNDGRGHGYGRGYYDRGHRHVHDRGHGRGDDRGPGRNHPVGR